MSAFATWYLFLWPRWRTRIVVIWPGAAFWAYLLFVDICKQLDRNKRKNTEFERTPFRARRKLKEAKLWLMSVDDEQIGGLRSSSNESEVCFVWFWGSKNEKASKKVENELQRLISIIHDFNGVCLTDRLTIGEEEFAGSKMNSKFKPLNLEGMLDIRCLIAINPQQARFSNQTQDFAKFKHQTHIFLRHRPYSETFSVRLNLGGFNLKPSGPPTVCEFQQVADFFNACTNLTKSLSGVQKD